MTAGSGADFAVTSVTAGFGARSSTGAVTFASVFAVAEVAVTSVVGVTTLLIAVATSSLFVSGAAVCGANEAAFGCGIAESFAGGEFVPLLAAAGFVLSAAGSVFAVTPLFCATVVVCVGVVSVVTPLLAAACVGVSVLAAGTYAGASGN